MESPQRLSAGWPEAVGRESQQERRHRLNEAARDAEERRRSCRSLLRLIAATYVGLFLLAVLLAVWGNPEQQRWALGALTTILGTLLGFLVGQKQGGRDVSSRG